MLHFASETAEGIGRLYFFSDMVEEDPPSGKTIAAAVLL